jgi:hypothetical protein
MRIPGASDKLQNKTAPELLLIAGKIAKKRGVWAVTDAAKIILLDRRGLLLYIRKHYDIYETLDS